MWIIIAILFVLFMCLFPYAARVIARRRMLTRFCRDIRRAGGKVRRLCRFPALSRNRAARPELLIRAGDTQYAVKLWSPWHREAELRVVGNDKAYESRAVGAPLTPNGARPARTLRSRPYTVQPTKLRLRTPSTIKQVRVLLVFPSYRRILRRESGGWRAITVGDAIFDKLLYTPSDLLVAIRHQTIKS